MPPPWRRLRAAAMALRMFADIATGLDPDECDPVELLGQLLAGLRAARTEAEWDDATAVMRRVVGDTEGGDRG